MPYAAPRSLDEAVSLLSTNKDARVLAGGHTLLVEPQRRTIAQHLLIDLRRIPQLSGIAKAGTGLRIGAMTTLADVAADAAIRRLYAVLAEVIEATGDPQMRNRATIGGSLAGTYPENDIPALAVVLDATVEITGAGGARGVAADDFFAGKDRPARGELITALLLPAREPRTGMGYASLRNPATLQPLVAVAAGVDLAADGNVSASRVVLVGATDAPVRLRAVEKKLAGSAGQAALAAAGSASDGLTMRTDLFASADYRKHLTRVLTERALKQALERAGG